jgi:hypothetical protein
MVGRKMRSKLQRLHSLKISRWLLLAAVLASLLGGSLAGQAQGVDESWAQPVNLSRSGSATSPQVVVDSSGVVHVLWSDLVAGFVYVNGQGPNWSAPVPVQLHFGLYPTTLFADTRNNIYAFWLDETSSLWASRVNAEQFQNSASWSQPQRLGSSIVALDAAADSSGQMHVSFIQVADIQGAPAGIYYRRTNASMTTWTTPALLYESTYFRSLTAATAHLRIATAEQDGGQKVFVAWDNRARERVFVARSVDGGATWDAPQEIDSPVGGSVTSGPGAITVGTQGQNVLLLWQSNHTASTCTQFYQWSFDGGDTWQPRGRLMEDVPGCPQNIRILTSDGSFIYLLTSIHAQSYLLAWDGTRWSSPQPQSSLISFTDPDTLKSIQLECRQAAMAGQNQLYVVGCDRTASQDIWITARSLDSALNWFSRVALWESPKVIASSGLAVYSPVLVSDGSSRIHALWSQPDSSFRDGPGRNIYHARFENGLWSSGEIVLTSPNGVAENPAAAVDPAGRLLVVWSGGESGEIYFSSVNAGRAVISSSWEAPALLPSPQLAGSSPSITVGNDGTIFVIYAIPLNEQRGIYLTRSMDGGQTWTEAVQIFDAGGAGWAMVDNPYIAWTANGHVHALWTRYTLPSGVGSLGLYYARSEDGGLAWSRPETVVDRAVLWSIFAGVGERSVHRLWQELGNGRTTLWHERSDDSGASWTRISPVSIFGETVDKPALTLDYAGRLHLILIVDRGGTGSSVQHWVWDGQTWENAQSLDLQDLGTENLQGLNAAFAPNGKLGVVFHGVKQDAFTGTRGSSLFFTSRDMEVPGDRPTPLPPLPPTPPPTATPTPQSQPTPTPTAAGASVNDIFQNPGASDSSFGSLIGPVAAGLIVLVVFVVSLRSFAGSKRYR